MTKFSIDFLVEVEKTLTAVDPSSIDAVVEGLSRVRSREGRLFVLGVGGSAGHASHAVNDFRKICGIEAYAPTDNVSELTARTNDEGWDTTFSAWLQVSRIQRRDGVLIFSVGGGNLERGVSPNLVKAIEIARASEAGVYGIVGRDGGYTAKMSTACIIIPSLFPDHVTPLTEGICAVMWHLIVTHPKLAENATMWESLK